MKRKTIFGLVLIFLVLINLSSIYVLASDDDDDGIDDDYESYNRRNINIETSGSETRIKSYLRTGSKIDEIQITLKLESDGIEFSIGYSSDEQSSDREIEFSVSYKKLIEFIDINLNGIFDNSTDIFIQEMKLDDFEPLTYSTLDINSDAKMHIFNVNTTDSIFNLKLYVAEEFTLVNDFLITPVEAKIDIEIKNFNFLNTSSKLALYTGLESEIDYESEDETEDEELGYAMSERGVINTNNSYKGFYSWNENASVDGNSKSVLSSPLLIDEYDENEQMIYLNYHQGNHIIHDPKIGIAGILRSIQNPPISLLLITLFLIIGVISSTVAYSVYHYRDAIFHSLSQETNRKVKGRKKIQKSYSMLSNRNLTLISSDFYETIDLFKWDEFEKEEFIKEMLSLSPSERRAILDEMKRYLGD